ncbi:c-type cytochrome [Cupriavidus consociatus]|uniref:c-type cytochrome n=1 Tax=Cupriavidus consociatus TaxID=2821357 RepID=UPI0024741872|nr:MULTISPECIES: c-type cytochrome [unclassified Cupriavidus]MDK2657848.1 c-type cytochrome [Cupriavidus sp. LEh21]
MLAAVPVILATGGAHAAVDVARAQALASQNACLGCHAMTTRLVGPSYNEVAAKYKGMDPTKLATSIRAGSKGKWGSLEMPPQKELSDADAKVLAEWVLSTGSEK